jgi:hypothetical protein
MSHFKLVRSTGIAGPHGGEDDVYLCSRTVRNLLDAQRPAGRQFEANAARNVKWLDAFIKHTGVAPDYVCFAKGESGLWYAQAVSL